MADDEPSPAPDGPAAFPLPPLLTRPASTPPELIAQGAEARVYRTTFLLPDLPCALKYRPPKAYRHPVLDRRLTRQRILAEAKVLQRLRRDGVPVPALYAVFEGAGCMMTEWIDGAPVRVRLNQYLARDEDDGAEGPGLDPELVAFMRRVGQLVGRIHGAGVVHGDLTTSNMMLRPWPPGAANGSAEGGGGQLLDGEIVAIDFGLASQSTSDEDRAVDLYVLERAFASTHSRAEPLFDDLLQGYKTAFKQTGPVLRKLEDVRMRGRKRSMIG